MRFYANSRVSLLTSSQHFVCVLRFTIDIFRFSVDTLQLIIKLVAICLLYCPLLILEVSFY